MTTRVGFERHPVASRHHLEFLGFDVPQDRLIVEQVAPHRLVVAAQPNLLPIEENRVSFEAIKRVQRVLVHLVELADQRTARDTHAVWLARVRKIVAGIHQSKRLNGEGLLVLLLAAFNQMVIVQPGEQRPVCEYEMPHWRSLLLEPECGCRRDFLFGWRWRWRQWQWRILCVRWRVVHRRRELWTNLPRLRSLPAQHLGRCVQPLCDCLDVFSHRLGSTFCVEQRVLKAGLAKLHVHITPVKHRPQKFHLDGLDRHPHVFYESVQVLHLVASTVRLVERHCAIAAGATRVRARLPRE
mmetsp:Transcript_13525/g.34509  ORF Transcript_13525/g.34509 Transcript_13525/m.34509 type:complete len:298 (-) Transcript_13525:305-1198(-)